MKFIRSFFFVGNKERLQKTVKRANGKMLSEQRFTVLMRDKTIQRHGFPQQAFCFRFHCRFQKKENGYEIQYFSTPDWWTLVRVLALPALLWWALYKKPTSIYLAGGALLLLIINLACQGVRCAKQFEKMCEK